MDLWEGVDKHESADKPDTAPASKGPASGMGPSRCVADVNKRVAGVAPHAKPLAERGREAAPTAKASEKAAMPRGRGLGRNALVEYADEHDGQLPDGISDAKVEQVIRTLQNTLCNMKPDGRNYQEAERRLSVMRRARLLRSQGLRKDVLERQEKVDGQWAIAMELIREADREREESEKKRRRGMELLIECNATSGRIVADTAEAAERVMAAAMAPDMLQMAEPLTRG